MTSAYTQHTKSVCFFNLLFLLNKMVGTRGFEATATYTGVNKINDLAECKSRKVTSNNLKTLVSAYSLHTLAKSLKPYHVKLTPLARVSP